MQDLGHSVMRVPLEGALEILALRENFGNTHSERQLWKYSEKELWKYSL